MSKIYVMFIPPNGNALSSFAGIETSLKEAKRHLDSRIGDVDYSWKRRQHRGLPCYFAEWKEYPKKSWAAIYVCTIEDGG